MRLLSRLFVPDPAEAYKRRIDAAWRNYERWRDSQTCIGCGEPYKGSNKHWVTEYECEPCWLAGIRGEPADKAPKFPPGATHQE